jgi:Gpi18-like mannosyltransferase
MSAPKKDRILYCVVALVVSAGVFLSYFSISGSWNFNPAAFPKMLTGTADRPYVYRQLIPVISKFTAWLVPQWAIELFQKGPDILKNTINLLSQGIYPREAIIAIILIYSCLVGFIFAERSLLKQLEYSQDAEQIIPIVLTILILPLTVFHGYIYDLPQLFLFTLGLLFIVRKQWHFYLPLLAIATLNKETSVFLMVIFALYFFRSLDRKTYFVLLIAQTIIYVFVHGLIVYLYRNNPGQSIYWTIELHIHQYSQYPITFLVTLLFFGAILFLVFKGWQSKPVFLRISFSVFFMFLVLFFAGGREMEFRVFIDILPIFGTLMFPYRKAV